jgi:glycosyltransferase involved in cell wall biosynthesis
MSGPRIRVLVAAFAAVPGSSPHSSAMLSMVDGLRGELDLVTLKTEALSHTKRIGEARMFRVPVGRAAPMQQRELYARAVGRQIEAAPYQVVHVFDPWAGVVAAELRRSATLVYEVASFPDPAPGEESLWLEAHERTLAAADRVLVATQSAADALTARGVKAHVEVVRPAVDLGVFDWSEVPRFGTPRLLCLGPFAPSRDLDTLLAAVARVAALRPVRLLLAGESDHSRRVALQRRVSAAGLDEVVDVRGEPSARSVPDLIAAADVCLAPASDHQPGGFADLPHPLLEYLACYRPVVAANVGGVSELIRDDVEGLLYPPGNAPALADAVLEALRDAVLRERITEAGYVRAREELSAGARRRRIRRVYEQIAPGSQILDPWRERFEEVTGLIELSTGALERLQATDPLSPLPRPAEEDGAIDTAETFAPAQPFGEKTRPRAPRPIRSDDGSLPNLDTQPGLVVPDTDPGNR